MRAPVFPFRFCCLFLLALGCSTGSKVVTTTGSIVGKTAATAISTSGKVAGATVAGTATIAKSAVTTTGSVATSIAKTAFVTVVDTATGATRQIPWTEGMKLYAAAQAGEVNAALKAIQLFRGNDVIASTSTAKLAATAPGPQLQPGDVIRISNLKP